MCKAFSSKTDADSDDEGEQKSEDLAERKTRVRFHVGVEKETSHEEPENSENTEQSPADVVPVINIIPPDDEEHQPEDHDTKSGDTAAEQPSAKPSTSPSTDVDDDGSSSPPRGRLSTKADTRKRITSSSPNLTKVNPSPSNGKKKGATAKNGQRQPAASSSDGAKKVPTAGSNSNKAQLNRSNSDRNLQKQQPVQASATQSSSTSPTAKK